MLCIHWLVQLMHCLYKALFMSNKTIYSFSYNTAILVVIIFVLSYAARTLFTKLIYCFVLFNIITIVKTITIPNYLSRQYRTRNNKIIENINNTNNKHCNVGAKKMP